jgi:hypothetical protein
MGGSTRNYDAYDRKRAINNRKNDPPPPQTPPGGIKPTTNQTSN